MRHGHISKQGSTWLRWILFEAAQTAKRHTQFAATYAAIAQRRGKKIATTAIARKLLTSAYHLLTEDQADATTDSASRRRARSAPAGRATTGEVTKPGRARIYG